MDDSLTNKTAIVTGGSQGYGKGIASCLAQAGARVWITGRNRERLQSTARQLGIEAVAGDVGDPADWDRLCNEVLEATGGVIDILVNNAGAGVQIAPLEEQSDEAIAASLATNLTGTIFGCRRLAPVMKQQGSGTILNISSVCSKHAWPGWSVYSAAKAGLDQFSKCLALELKPHGVRVTTLIPSWGATAFLEEAGLGTRDEEMNTKCIQPEELGKMVVQICSLPPHLWMQETILWPMIQDVAPL